MAWPLLLTCGNLCTKWRKMEDMLSIFGFVVLFACLGRKNKGTDSMYFHFCTTLITHPLMHQNSVAPPQPVAEGAPEALGVNMDEPRSSTSACLSSPKARCGKQKCAPRRCSTNKGSSEDKPTQCAKKPCEAKKCQGRKYPNPIPPFFCRVIPLLLVIYHSPSIQC